MIYDWKKTWKKIGIVFVEVAIAGTIVYFTDNGIFLTVIPVLEGLRNWFKHRND